MHQNDLPSISSSNCASNTVSLAHAYAGLAQGAQNFGLNNQLQGAAQGGMWQDQRESDFHRALRKVKERRIPISNHRTHEYHQEKEPMSQRRLVQVFIADPDENVPLDHSLLYSGEQKLTDATDQELFFEIDIKGILERHNAVRVTLVDKEVKERVEHLEPVKIRDLKMTVVNIATF